MKRLILIDAHAIIHRAYHALPPLTTPAGEPINAVYGFTTILLRILRGLKPDYIAAAFDLPGPTFRHIAYERYKAQRPETPSDLSSQFNKVREILAAFGITVFEKAGYEADDIIGTIAHKLEKNKEFEAVIVTGDLDTLQLVRPRLRVYAMKKGITETIIYDTKTIKERYGLKPGELIDFKGLKGDPSDNIAGVKGIGEKTAQELIKNFGSIEGVYKALKKGTNKISESVALKLRAGAEDARFSKELSTIDLKVPIKFELKNLIYKENYEKVKVTFQKFGFFSLLKRLNNNDTEKNDAGKKESAALPLVAASDSTHKPAILASEKDFQKFSAAHKSSPVAIIVDESALFLITQKPAAVFKVEEKLFALPAVRDFFEKGKDFWVYDGKSIIHFLRAREIELGGIGFDLMLAAYLTSSFSRDFSFSSVAGRELGRLAMANPPEEFIHFFAIARSLEAKLSVGKLKNVFYEIELPIVRILADLEERGISIDVKFLEKLARRVDGELEKLTEKIYELAGESFNINSSQQMSRILFEKLGIKTHGLRKTEKGGVISTGAAELEKLKENHPIIEKVLSYRELMKLKTTYIDALPKLINSETGRLHTTFNQTVTATGRLSSSNPNLQNIPIMTETGREIRKAFVADPGFSLVSFDYSQIELRVAAHIANDPKMIEAFKKGMDIHRMTASEIYNVPLDKVTPDLRRAAKTLNFGVLYGMGANAFAESTGLARGDAKKFIDEYFHDFAGIRDYVAQTKKFVDENGYVETIFGRRRYIPEIHSPNWQLRREAERMAVNMPIQGTATGDIVKMAMLKIDEWVKEKKLEERVRMLLQVHDELVFEIKTELLEKTVPKIKDIMENATILKVPLIVDVKAGPNWGEEKDIN